MNKVNDSAIYFKHMYGLYIFYLLFRYDIKSNHVAGIRFIMMEVLHVVIYPTTQHQREIYPDVKLYTWIVLVSSSVNVFWIKHGRVKILMEEKKVLLYFNVVEMEKSSCCFLFWTACYRFPWRLVRFKWTQKYGGPREKVSELWINPF